MKEFLTQLFAAILPKKTVDGALTALNKAITTLDKVQAAEEDKAVKERDAAYTANRKADQALAEAARARSVRSKLEALVS